MLWPRRPTRLRRDIGTLGVVLTLAIAPASLAGETTSTPAASVDVSAWRRALAQVSPASLVRFPESQGAPPPPAPVETALLTTATPAALLAVLLDPAAYCRAVKSLVRCEGGPTAPVPDAKGTRWRRTVDWELEIPLSNLAGRLEIEPDPGWTGVTLRFTSGDLAPGALRVRWTVAEPDGKTLLWASLTANVREANWLLRRLAQRDPWTEPAIRGAIVWIAAHAVAALAAQPAGAESPRPSGAMARAGDRPLAGGDAGLAGWVGSAGPRSTEGGTTWATVESAPSGRLASVRVARRWRLPAAAALHQIASVPVLSAFTGWSEVSTALSEPTQAEIDVEDHIPFVDFTARWHLSFGPTLEARAVRGAIKDARWSWSATSSVPSTIVFSSYPRLERSGWAPRRFIEAEPFLEHGLALALAYVNMMAVEGAVLRHSPPPRAD